MWEEKYREEIGELIPRYEVMGNEIFAEEFNYSTEAVYKYCIEHGKTWQEALQAKIVYSEEISY